MRSEVTHVTGHLLFGKAFLFFLFESLCGFILKVPSGGRAAVTQVGRGDAEDGAASSAGPQVRDGPPLGDVMLDPPACFHP